MEQISNITIQKMADTTGLSVHTLRYYEKVGLLSAVKRSSNGYRLYSASDVTWVEFLQRLKVTGMSIQQMQQFAKLRSKGDETITERRILLEKHSEIVQMQISELTRNLHALEEKIHHYKRLEEERKMMEDSRYSKGLMKLAEVDGKAGEEVVEPLGDLGRYIVEFAFGDIYSRDGLNLRERELATIAMLTVLGGREPQLRVHIGAGLNVGLTPDEIEEIIIQTVPYAGFPTAINAMQVLKEMRS